MRKIINYTTFENNEEFVQWQEEGSEKTIIQVVPQLMEIGLELTEEGSAPNADKNASGGGKTTFGIFVTYLSEPKEIEDESAY